MTCRNGAKLQRYMDGDLPPQQREALEQHLLSCLGCRRELAQLQRLALLLRESPAPPAPPEFVAVVVQRARFAFDSPARRRTGAPAWAFAGVAAAVLIVAINLYTADTARPRSTQLVAMVPPVADQPVTALPTLAVTDVERERPQPAGRPVAAPRMPHSLVRPLAPRARARTEIAANPQPALDQLAAKAFAEARVHADKGDPDLTVAALENVALAYPKSAHAAEALLTAAEIERGRGNLNEADAAYRCVLSLPKRSNLSRALAHKAIADMRMQTVGDDDMVRFHYAQASSALRQESAKAAAPAKTKALVALADIEKTMGRRDEAVAEYATAVSTSGGRAEDATASLAEVL